MSHAIEPERTRMRIPFHHCDPLFVVWHGRYFEYLEVARCALLGRYRMDVEDVRAMGYRMYVTDARCRYMAPLSYNDEVEITSRVLSTSPLLRITYDVRNLTTGRRAARAITALATTDGQGKLLTETPREMLERLPQL